MGGAGMGNERRPAHGAGVVLVRKGSTSKTTRGRPSLAARPLAANPSLSVAGRQMGATAAARRQPRPPPSWGRLLLRVVTYVPLNAYCSSYCVERQCAPTKRQTLHQPGWRL